MGLGTNFIPPSSINLDLVRVGVTTENDLFEQLLVAEGVAIGVRLKGHADRVDGGLVGRLLQNGPAEVADAPDGLGKDYPIELQVEMLAATRRLAVVLSRWLGPGLDNTLVGHGALLIQTVQEWSWRDNLRL